MRRLLAILLVLPALGAAGCGGDDSGSALDSALAYLPADAPFVLALETDVESDQYARVRELIRKFPFGGQAEGLLQQQLERSGADYENDIRPLLGNPAVVGLASTDLIAGAGAPDTPFVAAMQVGDEDALGRLLERARFREAGEESGATVYESAADALAVEGDVVVLASDRRQLSAALERADGDDRMDAETFEEGVDGLPGSSLARIYTNLEALLRADPASADARRVKWIAALRTLGVSITADDDSLNADFRVTTDGDLGEEDLPIAPGAEAPGVIERDGEIGLGIRDLAHLVRFAENAGQAIDPAGFGDYAQAKQTINSQLDVDLDADLIGQLTGNMSASLAIDGGFGLRAQLEDPQAFEGTLEKVADVLPSFAEGAGFGTVGLSKPGPNEDFYALAQPDGDSVVFGVVGEVLVVATDPARAGELARGESAEVPGAEGSVVMSVNAEQLAGILIEQFGSMFGLGGFGGNLLTAPLGDLNGSLSATPEELRGRFTLAIE